MCLICPSSVFWLGILRFASKSIRSHCFSLGRSEKEMTSLVLILVARYWSLQKWYLSKLIMNVKEYFLFKNKKISWILRNWIDWKQNNKVYAILIVGKLWWFQNLDEDVKNCTKSILGFSSFGCTRVNNSNTISALVFSHNIT